MSRILFALCALFAAASAADWEKLLRPEYGYEMSLEINKVVGKCVERTDLTVDGITIQLEKNIEEISHDIACAVQCFLENGPGAMDKVTKKLVVSDEFPAEVRYTIRACAADIEAQNVTDTCAKALMFKKICMPTYYAWLAQQ